MEQGDQIQCRNGCFLQVLQAPTSKIYERGRNPLDYAAGVALTA